MASSSEAAERIRIFLEPPDEEKETIGFLFKLSKSAADLPIPFHGDVADAIALMTQLGNVALLAFLLKMVLKKRITDDEIQLICDVYYHDE